MEYENGRSGTFHEGAQGLRYPQIRSIQQGAGSGGHHPNSVLETFQRSGNGLGSADKGRMLIDGSLLPTQNGRSEQTAEKRQWLDSPYRPFG